MVIGRAPGGHSVVSEWSAGAHLHQYYQEPDTGQWYNTKGIAIIQRGLFPVLYSHADQRSTITHLLTCRHSDMQVEDCKTSREGFLLSWCSLIDTLDLNFLGL